MKKILTFLIVINFATIFAQDQTELNKKIARDFYHDLWFTNHTEKYEDYVADEYVVHDTGNRKNTIEPSIVQKSIADFFWKNSTMSGKIVYQIAEGDLMATKWIGYVKPTSLTG